MICQAGYRTGHLLHRSRCFQLLKHAGPVCSVLQSLGAFSAAKLVLEERPRKQLKYLCACSQCCLSVYTYGGAFVLHYLPPCGGNPLIQWEPSRLHLFCLSAKHSFLVLTGNNLAGISNCNKLFNFNIDNSNWHSDGHLPYILQRKPGQVLPVLLGFTQTNCFFNLAFTQMWSPLRHKGLAIGLSISLEIVELMR